MALSEEQKLNIVKWYSEGLSTTIIAKRLEVSSEGVRYTLNKMGVALRSRADALRILPNVAETKYRYLTEEQKIQAIEMYHNKLSTNQIGKHFGVTSRTIKLLLNKNGIQLRSISEAQIIRSKDPDTKRRASESHKQLWLKPGYRENVIEGIEKNKIAFTCDEERMASKKGIIAGMMLGDGGLFIQKGGRHASLYFEHTMKQKPYLEHKANFLRDITEVLVNELKPSGKNPNWHVRCKTRTNPFYTQLYNIIYPDGKKKISMEWLSWITFEGLAIWYMDDGSFQRKGKSINLYTCGFSYDENVLIQSFLQTRFNLKFDIYKASEYTGDNPEYIGNVYYALRANRSETRKFFELVRPFIVPCMSYKID